MTAAEPVAVLPPTNLPEPVSELIGRDDELREIVSLAAAHRLVTLTGPGGIGKTRLALAVARQLLPQFADGVWVAELAPLADPGLVPATVAAAVGLELGGGEVSAPRVAQALADRRLLLVLDNCEHVIDAAAALAEAAAACRLRRCASSPPAASRSGRRGSRSIRCRRSPCPRRSAERRSLAIRRGSAVRRAGAGGGAALCAGPARLRMIAAICRRLDGIPLAIELAAARAAALGVEELAARLDDRFHLLTGGRRTALPRHQTLRATLDWSYELLPEPERVILRRLAIFAGAFSLEAASAVVASSELAPSDVVDGVSSLVAKSLVAAEVDGAIARYRLLDTTRAYALEKLAESGERELLARRHAEYYRDLFERAETEWETRPTAEWLADYGRQIDNLRAALDWAFSPGGDASIGVALTAAAVPLWMHLSLMEECRSRVERALAAIAREARPGPAPRDEAPRRAWRIADIYQGQLPFLEIGAAWTKVLEIAESLDDAEYQLRSLWGLWFFHTDSGRHRVALALAQRFCSLAAKQSDPNDRADRRADDRRLAALPGRPPQRATPPRAHARSIMSLPPRSRTSFAFRSTSRCDCARLPRADPMAAGISGSGDAHRRKQHRRRSGGQSRKFTVLRSGPGGMPDRAVGRRSGCGGTLRQDAARPIDKACAGALARLGPQLSGCARH